MYQNTQKRGIKQPRVEGNDADIERMGYNGINGGRVATLVVREGREGCDQAVARQDMQKWERAADNAPLIPSLLEGPANPSRGWRRGELQMGGLMGKRRSG